MKPLSNSAICPKCGGGHKSKPFCIYENGWHCFACGYKKVSDRGYSVHNRRIEIPEWPEAINNYESFSLNIKLWLTERGIKPDDVYKYNIYSDGQDNIFFVGCKDPLFYQKRNTVTREFKTYGQKVNTLLSGWRSEVLVIVEDFVSAIRVSSYTDTVCLWGTYCKIQDLAEWFKKYNKILVWLDNDVQKQINSGQQAAENIIKLAKICIQKYDSKKSWSINNKQIINIVTDKDPKCYTDSEIKEFIRSALNGHKQ